MRPGAARRAALWLVLAAGLAACSGPHASGTHAPEIDGGARGGDGGGPAGGGGTSAGAAKDAGPAGAGRDAASAPGGGSDAGAAGGAVADGAVDGGARDGGAPAPRENPWCVAPSASSSRAIASWAPEIAAAGVGWVRAFDQSQSQMALTATADNGLELSGIFIFSDPGPNQTFPVNSLPAFADYVTQAISDTSGKVLSWEVWNEPPNFSENKSPDAYAQVVVAAHDAAKAEDARVQVGLAAQSNFVNFLAQAIGSGAADHFDYVTVHPYEILGLLDQGFEGEYMSIVPTLRKMLADKDPARGGAPVWFTELGEPVSGATSETHQADTLVKAYVMGIAQGATRVCWFEPLDGDSGPFGLIAGGGASGAKRPAYTALATLVTQIGAHPRYVGWTLLQGSSYAFVFDGPAGTVMVAWTPPGQTQSVPLGTGVTVVTLGTGASAGATSVDLSSSPVLIAGVPAALRAQAQGNLGTPFPWGGDYSAASSVSFTAPDLQDGLHPLGQASTLTIDGSMARDQSSSPGQSFTVDPNFLSYTTASLRITAVVRRNGSDNAGFNLKYESTSGWKGTGSWYSVPGSDQWYTQSWTLDDPQFVGKWGYNFSFDSDSTSNSKYSIKSVTVTKL